MVLDSTDSVKAGYIGPSEAILYDKAAKDIDQTATVGCCCPSTNRSQSRRRLLGE
jgi:hypothetical protein